MCGKFQMNSMQYDHFPNEQRLHRDETYIGEILENLQKH